MTGGPEHSVFEEAVADVAALLAPAQLRTLAKRIVSGWPRHAVLQAVPVPGFADVAGSLLDAQRVCGATDAEAAAYLRGVAAGHAGQAAAVDIESVWSGPRTHAVPVRSTAQVLVALVAEAEHELMLTTYSAKSYSPLLDALTKAVARDVSVMVIVETLQGAGGALAGAEPAHAFASVAGVELWHWPPGERAEDGAKMHAKVAVADRRSLLVSSSNLTQSGVDRNMEAGLLVRGGAARRRAAEHLAELRARGVLARLG